jgi:hypothetical protein
MLPIAELAQRLLFIDEKLDNFLMIMAKWPFTNSPFCPESLLGKRTRTNCLSKLTQDLFSGRAIGTGIITRYLKQIFYLAERTIKNGKNNYKQFILLNNSRPY